MAQSGYTPIQLYRTATASAAPTAGNLADGELAINTADEKLYFKNAAGTVKLLAANVTPTANGGTGTSTTFTAGSVVFAGASGVYAQDNANLFWDDTNNNLGIGTSSPAYRLTAVGGATQISPGTSAQEGVRIQRATGVCSFTGINNDNNAYNALSFATGASEAMRIDTSGNVGIGNTAASVNDQVGGFRPLLVSKGDSSTTVAGSLASIVVGNADTTTNNSAQLSFAALTGASTTYFASSAINCIFGARTNGQYPTGQLVFSTSTALNQAPTEKMRIDSSGNVGIGTSAPNQKLQVVGSNGTGFAGATLQNSNANVGIAGIQFSSDTTYSKAAIGQLRQNPNGTGPLVFYVDTATDAADWSTGDEKMRIDASGNVGIGTSSPTNTLSVNGSINASNYYMQDSSAAAAGTYGFANSNGPFIQTWGNSSAQAGALVFATNGSERLRIASAGQIGIGGANYGTAGQVLTSNGSAAAPSWQAAGGSATGTLKNVQVFTSSGTYTRTAGVTTAVVIAVGGGGGGQGSSGGFASTSGGNGGTTSFGSHVSAVGGSGANSSQGGAGGTGGTGATIAIKGQAGGGGASSSSAPGLFAAGTGGGQGGGQCGTLGGGAGVAGVRGGGGGGQTSTSASDLYSSGGGGQGETSIKYTTTVGATETVTIGAGGTGSGGGAGGAGYVIVYEYS